MNVCHPGAPSVKPPYRDQRVSPPKLGVPDHGDGGPVLGVEGDSGGGPRDVRREQGDARVKLAGKHRVDGG